MASGCVAPPWTHVCTKESLSPSGVSAFLLYCIIFGTNLFYHEGAGPEHWSSTLGSVVATRPSRTREPRVRSPVFLFPVSHDFEMVADGTKEHALEAEKKVRGCSE